MFLLHGMICSSELCELSQFHTMEGKHYRLLIGQSIYTIIVTYETGRAPIRAVKSSALYYRISQTSLYFFDCTVLLPFLKQILSSSCDKQLHPQTESSIKTFSLSVAMMTSKKKNFPKLNTCNGKRN